MNSAKSKSVIGGFNGKPLYGVLISQKLWKTIRTGVVVMDAVEFWFFDSFDVNSKSNYIITTDPGAFLLADL